MIQSIFELLCEGFTPALELRTNMGDWDDKV